VIIKNILYSILACAVIVGSFFLGLYLSNHNEPHGRILFQIPENPPQNDVLIMNANGQSIQWVAEAVGPAVPSRDGQKLAVIGCFIFGKEYPNFDEKQICIYDLSKIPDRRIFPDTRQTSRLETITSIVLPQECKETNIDTGFSEVVSMSWSYDGERLLLVCGGEKYKSASEVCIVDDTGMYHCWDEEEAMYVIHADWSPINDLVVITKGYRENSRIYLSNPDGKDQKYIDEGWAAEWSSDGSRIAYIRYLQMNEKAVTNQMGIAIIDQDGSHKTWVYLSDFGMENYDYLLLDYCAGYNFSGECHLNWSPDGDYLVFTSAYMGEAMRLFQINIKTGKIIFLLHSPVFGIHYYDPEWIN
jgi:WD40 repeat protein